MSLLPFLSPEHLASFLTLLFLEIVLAADNLLLIAILSSRLPEHQRPMARRFGLLLAVVTRLLLLFSLFWLSHLETPIKLEQVGLTGWGTITPRQIVLGVGGLFLLWKSLVELWTFFRENGAPLSRNVKAASGIFAITIVQIAIFDIIFSLDSVIAAIGIAEHVEIMAAAVIIAALAMLFLVNPISYFIERHPTVKLIALNFLALVGVLLMAEAAHVEIDRIYFYIALAGAIVVQILAFWIQGLGRTTRLAVTGLVLMLAVAIGIGWWQNSNGQTGPLVDLFVYLSEIARQAQSAIHEFVAASQNWFSTNKNR